MNQPLVSVIVPAFRCAAYLPQAIESVLAQTATRVELIVVNDGSPDDTDEVVRPYLGRLQYIKQENRGLSAARNVGFRASNGEYVCFLDADDAFLPGKLEAQLDVFRREPDLGIVISGYIDVEEDGRTEILRVVKRWNRDGLDRLLRHEVFPPHTAVIRRCILESSSLFPEDIDTQESQEDWQLWLELALAGVQFGSSPEPTCLYRYRPGSIRRSRLRHNDGARRVVRWLRSRPEPSVERGQVDRLEAIVELERAAIAWASGLFEECAWALKGSMRLDPGFWMGPSALRRFFEFSLLLPEAAEWSRKPDPRAMRDRLVEGLVRDIGPAFEARTRKNLLCLGLLACSDVFYAAGDAEGARRCASRAIQVRILGCIRGGAWRSAVRAALGPRFGGELGRRLRALGGMEVAPQTGREARPMSQRPDERQEAACK